VVLFEICKYKQNQIIFCRVESALETLKHIADAIRRILQPSVSTKDFGFPFAWFFVMIFIHPMPAPNGA
jgi:hypothetical protein